MFIDTHTAQSAQIVFSTYCSCMRAACCMTNRTCQLCLQQLQSTIHLKQHQRKWGRHVKPVRVRAVGICVDVWPSEAKKSVWDDLMGGFNGEDVILCILMHFYVIDWFFFFYVDQSGSSLLKRGGLIQRHPADSLSKRNRFRSEVITTHFALLQIVLTFVFLGKKTRQTLEDPSLPPCLPPRAAIVWGAFSSVVMGAGVCLLIDIWLHGISKVAVKSWNGFKHSAIVLSGQTDVFDTAKVGGTCSTRIQSLRRPCAEELMYTSVFVAYV